jgi:hypothetical protein
MNVQSSMRLLSLVNTVLFCCSLLWFSPAQAQKAAKPSQMAKQAADYEKMGDFQQAAVFFEQAYNAAEDGKDEWMYRAGRNYMQMRDYANAAKCLEVVKDEHNNKSYDKAPYYYALALKQTGKYTEAKAAFEGFLKNYKGSDVEKLREGINTEIKGCSFGERLTSNASADFVIQHLDANINTDKAEFGPIPFGDGVLYFSSTVSGTGKIYRTQRKDKNSNSWIPRQSPSIFAGKMEKPHFGNGSFTPDGKRFYFTQCDVGNPEPKCYIYLMVEEEGTWSNPIKLPDYINAEGYTATHPFVTISEDKEILYFSSNRDGGRGGMDLWYCTRTAGSRGNNFTLPKNLGMNINTSGDEITPYYDLEAQTLYFSSDGWQSLGGLDIFKSTGSITKWEVPQNMGIPINSPADDLYFVLAKGHGGGYFVSNRIWEPTKMATTNNDIFYFGDKKIEVVIKGKITDAQAPEKGIMEDVSIKLFERTEGGDEIVEDRMLAVGEYKFVLQPKKNYVVEITKEGYNKATFLIDTYKFERSEEHTKDVAMEIPSLSYAEMLALIVPPPHNSAKNAYTLPTTPPNDPRTNEPAKEGSALYNLFKEVEEIAEESPTRQLYYSGPEKLVPLPKEEPAIAKNEPKKKNEPKTEPKVEPKKDLSKGPIKNFKDEQYQPADKGVTFKVQVAAVRKFREKSYRELQTIPNIRLEFEPIEGGMTRVLLVPEAKTDEGTDGFKTKADALDCLLFIINNTRFFSKSFVARYENNQRVGEGFRGWDEEESQKGTGEDTPKAESPKSDEE